MIGNANLSGKYAVFGNPVAHSRSPAIHARFAASLGQHIEYERQLVPLDAFASTLAAFVATSGVGANVTVPFKAQAFALSQERSSRATLAGAANTLVWRENHWYCDNTDGVGLVRDLQENHRIALSEKRILLLGAGGAARGVIEPLLIARPASLTLYNRTHTRALELANLFRDIGPIETITASEVISHPRFDIIINATSASLSGVLPIPAEARLFTPTVVAYDMMYGQEATPFMLWAQQNGATQMIDGLGMLVEQAAESFYLWRGTRPQTAPVIAAIRAELGSK